MNDAELAFSVIQSEAVNNVVAMTLDRLAMFATVKVANVSARKIMLDINVMSVR